METVVLSLGGSVIVPDEIDVVFLSKFRKMIMGFSSTRFVIICGGGRICRRYQDVARSLSDVSATDLDWLGIMATRLNAELMRVLFNGHAFEKIIHDPEENIDENRRIIIGAGFRPGSSTDLRAVQLAKRFGANRVVNISNIDYVYDSDPRKNPDAVQLKHIAWSDFIRLVGSDWEPGLNMPFDPVASREASQLGLEVVIIGNCIDNLKKLLMGEDFEGTVIS